MARFPGGDAKELTEWRGFASRPRLIAQSRPEKPREVGRSRTQSGLGNCAYKLRGRAAPAKPSDPDGCDHRERCVAQTPASRVSWRSMPLNRDCIPNPSWVCRPSIDDELSQGVARSPALLEEAVADEQFLTARKVMARYGVSKNTLYGGPLRTLAVRVGKRSLRWPLSRLKEAESGRL